MPKKTFLRSLLLASTTIMLIGGASTALAQQNDITFDQVVAEPNNLELNLAYAKQQAQNGRLLAAAATLERLLIQEPGWDDARLFYAVVLYRLGDLQAADREIELLESRSLSPDTAKEYERYSSRVNEAMQMDNFTGQISLGYVYDENITGFVDDGFLSGTAKQGDDGYTLGLQLQYTRRISVLNDSKAFALLRVDTKQFSDLDAYSQTAATGVLGVETSFGKNDISAALAARNVAFDGDTYFSEYGFRTSAIHNLSNLTGVGFEANYMRQDYSDVTFDTLSTQFEEFRTGAYYSLSGKAVHKFGAKTLGSAALGYVNKSARYAPYEYDGLKANAAFDHAFANGIYADIDYIFQTVDYATVDTLVITDGSTDKRSDDRHYVRAALGLPLRSLFSASQAHSTDNAFKVEMAIYHDNRDSNYDVYNFENTGGEVKLVWRFDR